jgi:hypothetical protein
VSLAYPENGLRKEALTLIHAHVPHAVHNLPSRGHDLRDHPYAVGPPLQKVAS